MATPTSASIPVTHIPYAQKEYKTVKIGNKIKIDNYYWMRDDTRQNPKVINNQFYDTKISDYENFTEYYMFLFDLE